MDKRTRPAERGHHLSARAVGLDRIGPRILARIVDIDPGVADTLRRDGIDIGGIVSVAGRAPFGGAFILELDRVRVAVPLDLARAVVVVPVAGSSTG